MDDPPHGDKQRQQQAIEPLTILNQARFQVPAATLTILKGGFHAHAPARLPNTPSPSRLIGDQEPRFFVPWFPDGTQVRLDGLVLPEQDASKPLLTWLADHLSARLPVAPTAAYPTSTGMLGTDAHQVMPLAVATQLNQWRSTEATIGDQRPVTRLQIRCDLIEHLTDQVPLALLPVLLLRHHAPTQRQHPALHQQAQIHDRGVLATRGTVQYHL